jgi:hypothetical protein
MGFDEIQTTNNSHVGRKFFNNFIVRIVSNSKNKCEKKIKKNKKKIVWLTYLFTDQTDKF